MSEEQDERHERSDARRAEMEKRKDKLIVELYALCNEILEDVSDGGPRMSHGDVSVFGALFVHEAVQCRVTVNLQRD